MSSRYLEWLIREQIDRVRSLRDAIPNNLRHAALVHLAAMCNGVLEEQARELEQERALLNDTGDAGIANALSTIRDCTRTISEIEGYGIPPLHCQSDQAVFLNDVLSAMHREVGLLPPRPATACTSNEYYFTHLQTRTIHVPLSEAEFLLHMPDFYHELGHLLYASLNRGAKYGPIRDGVDGARGAVDRQYLRQANGTDEGAASAPTETTEWMWAKWRSRWILESFCDLFALFAAGPAYAYSNLHLVSKTDLDMYQLNLLRQQDHPSGEARMRLLDIGMRMLGYADEAARVKREWDVVAHHFDPPRPEYDRAFPSELLEEIASSILPAFGRAGLHGYRSDGERGPEGVGATPVAALLNDGWNAFWRDGDAGFREVEKAMITKLAAVAREGAAARQ